MKRVDYIIKYLSGDLPPDEIRSFERELNEDPQLHEEFSQVSSAYRMIGDQLRIKDEEAFRSRLKSVMNRSPAGKQIPRSKTGRWLYLFMAVAASITLLLILLRPEPESKIIYTAWYNPSEDPVLMTFKEETRGTSNAANSAWLKGNYKACKEESLQFLSEDSENREAMLFYLLSSMELNRSDEALERLKTTVVGNRDTLGQAITWYHALALIKAGDTAGAALILAPLEELPGPYKSDAHKLKKMLTK